KTEPSVPEVVVLDPNGLQTLDELVVEPEINRPAIAKLTKKQLLAYRQLRNQLRVFKLQHRHVFEALREQSVRLFTLGVTGFDTPGTGAALPEARVAFATLANTFEHYAPALAARQPELNQQLRTALSRGREMLRTDDFDGFDRLTFLREVINPLTEGLPTAQHALEIESVADFQRQPQPVNHKATTLFADDFLNADYYANLTNSPHAEQKKALGELLFFDPVLSKNLTTSCATCHQPDKAFTDGYARSLRADGEGTVLRNSPTLLNSVYAAEYFYDLREEFLERQMMHVVSDAHEFATDFITIEQRLRQSEEYRELFAEAYADQPKYQLSKWSISDALSHYVLSLRSFDSPFDRYARGETDLLPEQVKRGFNLFMGKATCGTCHFAPTFNGLVPPYYSDSESEVLGVPATVAWENATVDPDPGRIASGRPQDEAYYQAYAFKTTTVRNAAITAPYMHNGVYTTLEQVMDFYNRGGGAGIGIDLPHQTLPPVRLELTQGEIDDVIAFMESLTDFEKFNHRPERLPAFPDRAEWNQRYE
ncbi:MAG: cytochrome c peroxidase, partial [Bacteroidota bacterium]